MLAAAFMMKLTSCQSRGLGTTRQNQCYISKSNICVTAESYIPMKGEKLYLFEKAGYQDLNRIVEYAPNPHKGNFCL
jgi:hypothetical protein